jgi:hypothetical protein
VGERREGEGRVGERIDEGIGYESERRTRAERDEGER